MRSSATFSSKWSNLVTTFPGECCTTNTIGTFKNGSHGFPILTHDSKTIRTMPRQGEILLVTWLDKLGCLLSLFSTSLRAANRLLEPEDGGASVLPRIWARGMKTYLVPCFPMPIRKECNKICDLFYCCNCHKEKREHWRSKATGFRALCYLEAVARRRFRNWNFKIVGISSLEDESPHNFQFVVAKTCLPFCQHNFVEIKRPRVLQIVVIPTNYPVMNGCRKN